MYSIEVGKSDVLDGLLDSPLPRSAMRMILWLRRAPEAWVRVVARRPLKQVWTMAILSFWGLRIW